MAIFTAIAAAIGLTGFAATAFVTVASLATSFALSYAVKALAGKPQQSTDSFGVQGQLQGGGAVPRSFGLGFHATAGSLVYANFFGQGYDTPNALQCWVIAVSDLPEKLKGFHVNGQQITLPAGAADYQTVGSGSMGYAVPEYIRPHNGEGAPTPHLWLKYYDGTQTAADAYLVASMAATARPYQDTRVGKGVSYFIAIAFNDENLWNGFPTFKAELSGIALYDPSKDSTVGGSGPHRYADPSTWGGDGDNFPAVQAYAVLRGISYAGVWLYGLQNTAAARLPITNWITQIEKCRFTVEGDAGPEPTYRTGLQVNVDAQPVNLLEALMTGCQGKISEVGGFYKCHLGAPDSVSFSFTDGDILSTESQTFRPFFALSDSVNGIQATYPDPAQGWNTATAPAYYRTDLEVKDGNRRLMASPAFDAVPYPEQVQRLQKSAIEVGQRARGHTVTLGPAFWLVEPGDVGAWTSVRNGYSAKQFQVDAGTDKANLDAVLVITEVDPSDYDWDRDHDLRPVEPGTLISNPPPAQGVTNWDAEPYTLVDSGGVGRRPAILISWDVQPGVSDIAFEIKLASDGSAVTHGRVGTRFSAGNRILTEGLLPATTYQVRGQYIPSSPRDMLWSGWVNVTTPDVKLTLADVDAAIHAAVTTLHGQDDDKLNMLRNTMMAIQAMLGAQSYTLTKEVRSELSLGLGNANAYISQVQTVSVATDAALASDIEDIVVNVAANTASIAFNASAIADVSASLSSYQFTNNAAVGSLNASVSSHSIAIATLNGIVGGSWGVDITVGGVIRGAVRLDAGASFSAFTVQADKFQFQLPGYNGGSPVAALTVGTLAGSPAFGFSGNMYLDGTLNARAIVAGSITAVKIGAGELTSDSGVFGALSVKSLSIADNAVTVPVAQALASNVSGNGTSVSFFSFDLSIDTTGLSGKTIPVFVDLNAQWVSTATSGTQSSTFWINVNGVTQTNITASINASGLVLVPLSCIFNITGNGSTITIPIACYFSGSGLTYMQAGSTIFAEAVKR
ncbi:phage tail protein [Bradyrhizobium sp. BR 10289]|uniref:phage tail protein n=1 Tax=Bradyrhizobium sp. BR 10289 TaxID=2749993 RepID=UPI001C645940|nr:phage tail protein [Bradyrhizobium sp. BR 10289]MBW7968110.1 phage tail protein [Bradyrhizobium sp. BR 10289]